MTGLAMNNHFGSFVFGKRNSPQIKRGNNSEARVPSQINIQEYKDSGYYLDSISEFPKNQSLTAEQIAESRAKAVNDEINALRSKYEISNFEEVKNFLSKNRVLISLLEEIPNKIYQYFGNSQKLALEVLYEPDLPDSSELWILVLTELSAKEARSIMNKFDKEWWLENLHKANCKLNVGIEYV